jgi:glutamyl/glutaminyl-tRNA synthetase
VNVPARAVTRFAPSPTGPLHLGHVANAVHVWGLARRIGAQVVLRMEDHDRLRCRPEFEESILDDLEWLGLEPDIGPVAAFRSGPTEFRQSDRDEVYHEILAGLRRRRLTYACSCSRRTIAEASSDTRGEERRYPGTCRELGVPDGPDAGLRVVMADGFETFTDLLLGRQTQTPIEQCGDLLVRDRRGHWTYHWAVTVDDYHQGVNLVIRGADLLGSTGRQIRLARLIGRESAPVFYHHALICDSNGRKLSKRDGDAGVRELRAMGWSPEAVLGRAAFLVGLLKQPTELLASDLPRLFA